MSNYETKNVVFDQKSLAIVEGLVEELNLGQRGFSAALRKIIRDWDVMSHSDPDESLPDQVGE